MTFLPTKAASIFNATMLQRHHFKKRGGAHTHTPTLSPRLSPAVGCKKGLLMFQPYLCKSHFAVQSQWSIAPSFLLSSSPSARTPSQDFLWSLIRLGQHQTHYFNLICFSGEYFLKMCCKRRILSLKEKDHLTYRDNVWIQIKLFGCQTSF